MPVIRNKSVLGELDIPLLRRFVKFGEEIEVSAEHALEMLKQSVNWDAVDDEAKKIEKEIAGSLESDLPVEPELPVAVTLAAATPPSAVSLLRPTVDLTDGKVSA